MQSSYSPSSLHLLFWFKVVRGDLKRKRVRKKDETNHGLLAIEVVDSEMVIKII